MAHFLPNDLANQRSALFNPMTTMNYDAGFYDSLFYFVSNVWHETKRRRTNSGVRIYYSCRCKKDAVRTRDTTRGLRKREYFDKTCPGTLHVARSLDGAWVTVLPSGKPHVGHSLDDMDYRGMSDALRMIIRDVYENAGQDVARTVRRLHDTTFEDAGGQHVTNTIITVYPIV